MVRLGELGLGKRGLEGEGETSVKSVFTEVSDREDGPRLILGNIQPWRFVKCDEKRHDTTRKLVLLGGGD